MSDRLQILQSNPAPHPGTATFTADAGGSGWDTDKYYSAHVVAFYHESGEDNIYRCGAWNRGFAYDMALCMEDCGAWENKKPANATDTLTVTWTAPTGLTPDHYAVYIQESSGSTTGYRYQYFGKRYNTTDMPPTTLSLTILSPIGSIAANYVDVRIVYVDATNKTVYVDGNKLIYCGINAPMILDYGHANLDVSVASATLAFNPRGILTAITVNEAITGTVAGDLLRIYTRQAAFGWPTGTATMYPWGISKEADITRPLSLTVEIIPQVVSTADGLLAAASLPQNKLIGVMSVTFPSMSCSYEMWSTLNLWARSKTLLWLLDVNSSFASAIPGTDTTQTYSVVTQYQGRILALSNVGSLGKHRGDYSIVLGIESEQSQGLGLTYAL